VSSRPASGAAVTDGLGSEATARPRGDQDCEATSAVLRHSPPLPPLPSWKCREEAPAAAFNQAGCSGYPSPHDTSLARVQAHSHTPVLPPDRQSPRQHPPASTIEWTRRSRCTAAGGSPTPSRG
jgi:hypothetical protein